MCVDGPVSTVTRETRCAAKTTSCCCQIVVELLPNRYGAESIRIPRKLRGGSSLTISLNQRLDFYVDLRGHFGAGQSYGTASLGGVFRF